MTRLEESLRELAAEVPQPSDIAERALRTSRRRRNRVRIPTMAAAAIAVAGVTILAAVGLSTNDVETVNMGPDQPETVRFPKTAPGLPAEDVGPATFAYGYEQSWRVMLADGEHFEVPDAVWPGGEEGFAKALLTVSPDGKRLGYLGGDGTFVLRELASGEVTSAFQWDRRVFSKGQQEAVWSADGRWLLVIPGPDFRAGSSDSNCVELPDGGCRPQPVNELADPVLLDTASMRTVELPDTYNQLFGVSNGDALFPYVLGYGEKYRLPLFDHQGTERGQVPADVLPGKGGVLGNISPDGRTLVTIAFGGEGVAREKAANLRVIDLDAGRVVHKHSLGGDWMKLDSPSFGGWMADDKVLIQSAELERIPGADKNEPNVRDVAANIHAVDIDTGEWTHLFHLPGKEGFVASIAYRTLGE